MLDNEPKPTIDEMWVLVKWVGVFANPKIRETYTVGAKRSWINAPNRDAYELLAEHHDKQVLEKMKQLAIEGDNER